MKEFNHRPGRGRLPLLATMAALLLAGLMPAEASAQLAPLKDEFGNPITSATSAGTSISKRITLTGNYDYAMIGATESQGEAGSSCNDVGSQTRTLSLPSGATVVKAYLYWSGSAEDSGDIDNTVRLNGTTVNASETYTEVVNGGWDIWFYGAYKDVTNLVTGGGSYTVSHLSWHKSGDHCSAYSAYGGWSLVVVYEQASLPARTIDVFDGFDGGDWWPARTYTVHLNGLSVPSQCLTSAEIGLLMWEGDNYKSEKLRINGNFKGNNTLNGSTDANLDIDTYSLLNDLSPGDTSLDVSVETWVNNGGLEWYIHNAFVVKYNSACDTDLSCPAGPAPGGTYGYVNLTDNSRSCPTGTNCPQVNYLDVLEYTFPVTNNGPLDATNVEAKIYYPPPFSFVSASGGSGSPANVSPPGGVGLSGDFGAVTYTIDALNNGATENMTVQLQAALQNIPSNTLLTVGLEVFSADQTDPDSEAGNLLQGGQPIANNEDDECFAPTLLPVELTSFEALTSGRSVTLTWATASETNNAGFEVQHRLTTDAGFAPLRFVEGAGTTLEAQTYSHRVEGLAPGRHVFRLKQIDFDGAFEYSPEIEVSVEMPDAYQISPVYPNPFNPQATFSFGVRQAQEVTVELFNVLGQRVEVLYRGTPAAGSTQSLVINGSGLHSGSYLLRVRGEHFVETQVITLVK